ncbi:hypothetical protein I7634_01860 [Mycoplasma mycoides subsp. capri]|uniref:hypothetical protein n=1 Tax=Mycoplasma mycoides TaxID=2102 RepID=UPI0022406CE5|nr:hypothetical protein [Mycoplasma mycoides]QVJ96673.1 hypothetical protein I7632_01890 [Mycoplasma mycoides subsp. capri]QVJ97563.1 hypothetical protein I7633_01860 [Mycoplasma mycoides subsp. capri]QVK00556.1 hypothetical protein I7634_01860 [Mycoplasma mycoides subsp. capri]QVK01443.1 hypothetical protein I7635_01860 [Mycoplasma mycoides subsp. capri]
MKKIRDLHKQILTKDLIDLLYSIQQIDTNKDNFIVIECYQHQELYEYGKITDIDLMNTINWEDIRQNLEFDFEPIVTKDSEIEIRFIFHIICMDCLKKFEITNEDIYFTNFEVNNTSSYENQEQQIIDQLEQKIKTKEIVLDEWIEY